jgi:tetratricopeptide (TPR) repeat protein
MIKLLALFLFLLSSCSHNGLKFGDQHIQSKTEDPKPLNVMHRQTEATDKLESRFDALHPQLKESKLYQSHRDLFLKGVSRLKEPVGPTHDTRSDSLLIRWMGAWLDEIESLNPDSVEVDVGTGIEAVNLTAETLRPPELVVDPCSPNGLAPFDFRGLESCANSFASNGANERSIELYRLQVNPDNSLVAISKNTLSLARLYRASGQPAQAAAVVDEYLALYPLLKDYKDSLENADQQESLATGTSPVAMIIDKISNLQAVQADYGVMRPLFAEAYASPLTDSLLSWVRDQEKNSISRNRQKIKQQLVLISETMNKEADFKKADELMIVLETRHAWFATEFEFDRVRALINTKRATISEKAGDLSGVNVDELEKEANALMGQGQLLAARDLFQKLLSSDQKRKSALKSLNQIADNYCSEKRQMASKLFAEARSQSRAASKRDALTKALNNLDSCLKEFPDTPLKEKIVDNREVILKDLATVPE